MDIEKHTDYKVVVNHEEQYALWPAGKSNALGWTDTGAAGSKEECFVYIREKWVDMRPLSLRNAAFPGPSDAPELQTKRRLCT